MKRAISLPGFNAVAAGGTATLDLPTTGTYHGLLINHTETGAAANQATMETNITEIRMKVNGKVQRRLSAEMLFDTNVNKGQTVTTGLLEIHFAEPWRRAAQGEDALAWGMGDVDTFQIEIDLAAGATNPTLSAKAIWTPDERPMGAIVKQRQYVIPVTATGIVNVTTLPKQDAYYALHAKSGDIDDVEIKVNREEFWKLTASENSVLQGQYGRVPVSGWFHILFDVTNRAQDALAMVDGAAKMVSDFQVDFNMNAANSFTLLTETLGLRD